MLLNDGRYQELEGPVTAKLSLPLHEKLGEAVANELVDWFNQVDTTYRGELVGLNRIAIERSADHLDRRFAEFDLKVERRFTAFEAKVDQRFTDLEAKLNDVNIELAGVEARLGSRIEQSRSEMVSFKAELIKWMFLFWIGSIATTLAISQALR